MSLESHCHLCPHASPPPYAGACYCLFDKANPVNIIDRAASGKCPDGRFDAPPKPPPLPGPGDVVKLVLHRLGYVADSNCGCEAKRQEMNALGWWGCWRKRAELAEWFAAKAAAQGITVDRATVPGLLVAAWREQRKK
jgi:hypothetical protein